MNSIVYNEDCMLGMDCYPDNYFDLAIVDPPYGIGEANEKKMQSRHKSQKKYKGGDWDNSAPNAEYFDLLKRKSKNQIIWGANHFIDNIPFNVSSPCWIFWDKDGYGDFADGELAWTSFTTAVRKFLFTWNGFRQGYDFKDKENRIHPTQKPIALYSWIYHNYLPEGGKVIDTHLGSGSNRIAADKAGNIDFTGFELDKEYFDAQELRFKNYKSQLKLF